jgi:hypothetical protein
VRHSGKADDFGRCQGNSRAALNVSLVNIRMEPGTEQIHKQEKLGFRTFLEHYSFVVPAHCLSGTSITLTPRMGKSEQPCFAPQTSVIFIVSSSYQNPHNCLQLRHLESCFCASCSNSFVNHLLDSGTVLVAPNIPFPPYACWWYISYSHQERSI